MRTISRRTLLGGLAAAPFIGPAGAVQLAGPAGAGDGALSAGGRRRHHRALAKLSEQLGQQFIIEF